MTVLFCALIALDQESKYLMPVVFLNNEAAFGLALPYGELIHVLSFSLITLVLYILKPINYNLVAIFILAGGLSNLLDRLLISGVRDIFIIKTLYFNLADVYIGVAVLLLVLTFLQPHREKEGDRVTS